MKIAICTPVYGDTRTDFTFSLVDLVIETMKRRPDIELQAFRAVSSDLRLNREKLVELAVDGDADYILWLDADHSFPSDTLISLLDRGEQVIGANYPRRHNLTPTAAVFDSDNGGEVWTTKQKVHSDLIEPVDYLGLGVCLVSMKAIAEAERPLFSGEEAGEDVIFFKRLREAGYQPKVDHRLSAKVGHIGVQTFTNEDAIRRKNEIEIQRGLSSNSAVVRIG